MNPQEVLFVAIKQARASYEMGHKAPLPPRQIVVAGKAGIANAEQLLVNMRDGGFISAYDYQVAKAAAIALCGGEIEGGSVVDEAWILRVEREQFVQLLTSPLTQARMKHTMETGKPLRN
jgi:3-hydroxyacyl-CoA dehydrogenase